MKEEGMKEYHIGDILSITTSRLVSLRRTDGVYDILNYMTDDNLFTHQLPRASEACRPALLEQYPELAGVDISGMNGDNWREWLGEQEKRYGAQLPVRPLELWYRMDPFSELQEMMPNKPIIIVGGDTP